MAFFVKFQGANPQPPPPMKPSELYYSKMTPALKEKVSLRLALSGRKHTNFSGRKHTNFSFYFSQFLI